MNIFNQGFTAEEAALIATNLESFSSIDQAFVRLVLDASSGTVLPSDLDSDPNYILIKKARSILAALIQEVQICLEYNPNANNICPETDLIIYTIKYDQHEHLPCSGTSLITRRSFAAWFRNQGLDDIAEKFKFIQPPSSDVSTKGQTSECNLGKRKEETYLKIIGALATALSEADKEAFQNTSGNVLIGYSKNTGDSGIVGHLMINKHSSLKASVLQKAISDGIKALKD